MCASLQDAWCSYFLKIINLFKGFDERGFIYRDGLHSALRYKTVQPVLLFSQMALL